MTAQSDAFEELNTRIEKLRQVAGVDVQHDAKVPDPDDPNEERQIDILIQNNGRRTGVECRDRAGSQSVMWVEELIGRKQSLQLDAIIGVAVSGFSKLAQTKAKRYGIALYDYRTLTDTEIASWAGAAHVEAVFVQFDPLCIVAGVPASAEQQLPQHVTLQFKKTDGYAAIINLVRDDVVAHQGIQRFRPIDPNGFDIDGIPVRILQVGYAGRLVTVAANCTSVQVVGDPATPAPIREVSVQQFDHTVEQVIRSQSDVHMVIDVSGLHPPPDAILHEIRIEFSTPVNVKEYELVGDRTIRTNATNIVLQVVTIP